MAIAAEQNRDGDRPNVVIVMTDDQGYGDLSCHGNPILKTPALDRLYEESIRLTDYHVAPTCSPTRAALLTGHWTNRTGVWHTIMGRSMLRENEVTMGDIFQASGYATGMFGKWHLGDNYPYRAEDRGFNEVMRHGGGGVGQTPDYWDNAYFDGSYWHNGDLVPVQGFCTDVFFDYAKDFIARQNSAGKPFLAYIATNAPHGPMHCPTEYSQPYREHGTSVANFFGMIANIDDNVGGLVKFLDDQQLTENTILIFTTDNGTSSGMKIFNAGMRGQKGSQYDGGHRVPLFIRWPRGNLMGGRDCDALTAHVDVVPTLIDLCRLQPPQDVLFDGRSIRTLLEQEQPEPWPDRILVTDSQRVKDPIKWRKSAVMTSRWRLIDGKQLFDIDADPGQRTDVAEQHPAVMARLKNFYENWWSELEPTFAESTPIRIGHAAENPSRLTSHDWISAKVPWNQSHIRSGLGGKQSIGHWNIEVATSGRYEIRLRRWPQEIDQPIDAALPPGEPVSGNRAFRETPGVAIKPNQATIEIADLRRAKQVSTGDKEVKFEVMLPAGRTKLTASFQTDAGKVYGAYYAYVELLDTPSTGNAGNASPESAKISQ